MRDLEQPLAERANAHTVKQNRTVAIAGGVLTVLVGIVILRAAAVQSRDVGKITSLSVELFGLGLILICIGTAISFLASKRCFQPQSPNKKMFNLEQSIEEWRAQMFAAGVKTPVPLEELEIHLRDEVEQHVKSGLAVQRAFEISVPHVGSPELLNNEFKKCEKPLMKQPLKIGLVVAGIFAGAALTVPGDIQLRDELVVANGRLGLYLLGWVLIVWSLQQGLRQAILPKGSKVKFENLKMTMGKQPVKTGAGIVVLLIGVALMLPAAAQVCSEGLMRFEALCGMVFGIGLLWAGTLVTFWPYEKRKA